MSQRASIPTKIGKDTILVDEEIKVSENMWEGKSKSGGEQS